VIALFAGGAGVGLAEPVAVPRWDYEVTVAPGLEKMTVRVCFEAFRPKRLALVSGGPLEAVRPTANEPQAAGFDPTTRSWAVERLEPGRCVEYEVDLARLSKGSRAEGCVVVEAGEWLLRPVAVPEGLRATVSFRLPEGASVSAPWARTGNAPPTFLLDPTTWAFIGHVAIGRFASESIAVAGTTLEVAILEGRLQATRAGVRRWLEEAAKAVAALYRGFPRERVQVVVNPVPRRGGDAVPFGSSWQGGGAALLLQLAQSAWDEELPGEWVAVHEMVHLGMPPIETADAWLAEGFTTYYQEVLRARSGHQSALQAWKNIDDGFRRGWASGGERTLEEESRRMRETHQFLRVYWAGAAIALRLDVALRRDSGGARSLDDAMRLLRRARPGAPRLVPAKEIVAEIDAWAGKPVFSGLSVPALASTSFPSLEETYAWLGLEAKDGSVSLRDDAPGASVRRAIMGEGSPVPGSAPSGGQ
jgi:hypothetical protein